MNLILTGGSRNFACTWASFALIRDNVQHFIEGGAPTERFAALHGIEQAVDFGRCSVDAARLRGEVIRALHALEQVPMSHAAVSIRTRAILTGAKSLPTVRSTVRAQSAGWHLPVVAPSDQSVAESGASFLEAVLALTASCEDGDFVEVFCSRTSRSRVNDYASAQGGRELRT